ncbi:succinate dehydrogenase cytochrome b subunit [Limibacter armeniacum]|uniref:succinate dehydrogenase cytochrome b subunit n=1 Tax=Limibacter armeniacum TaxID=466084 RepID=UPI002FE6A015
MSWLTRTLSSSVGKKLLMATSGILLIVFLIGHLAGNLQLLMNDGGEAFNKYAHFMSTNGGVQITAWAFKLFFAVHIIWAVILTINNRKARGPHAYAKSKNSASSWASANMGLLGSLIFVFLVIHLAQFWGRVHYGSMPEVSYAGFNGGSPVKDLYLVVMEAYQSPMWVALYVISMAVLAYHLWHGFASAFQTLGVNNSKYTPIVKLLGYGYSIVVPALFAIIPVVMMAMGK